MCSTEMKQIQCSLCRLSGLTPAPAQFLGAAPSLAGCVAQLLVYQWADAFLVLLYLIGSLESET